MTKPKPPKKPASPSGRLAYRPEAMAGFVAATLEVIRTGTGMDGAWMQGLQCWGEVIIPGWPGDNGYATRHVEVHGDTLCLAIEQTGFWYVIEIDEPVRWKPRTIECAAAKAVRRYDCKVFKPDRGWLQSPVTRFPRPHGRHKVFN